LVLLQTGIAPAKPTTKSKTLARMHPPENPPHCEQGIAIGRWGPDRELTPAERMRSARRPTSGLGFQAPFSPSVRDSLPPLPSLPLCETLLTPWQPSPKTREEELSRPALFVFFFFRVSKSFQSKEEGSLIIGTMARSRTHTQHYTQPSSRHADKWV
jgi:hypothetical protein